MKPITLSDYQGEFFKILASTKDSQIGIMTLRPGQDSGPEDIHLGDQVVYVLEGLAEIEINGERAVVEQGMVLTIPAKAQHHIYNNSSKDLFILSIYAPPAY